MSAATRPGRRDPQKLAFGIGDDLHVHAVAPVLVGVISASVAQAVALAEGAVQEHVVQVVFTQSLEQARRPLGEEPHDSGGVRVGGAYGCAEPGGDLRESVVLSQVGESNEGALVRRELATAVTSRVTISIVTHSTSAFGRSSAAG